MLKDCLSGPVIVHNNFCIKVYSYLFHKFVKIYVVGIQKNHFYEMVPRIAQSVKCLTADPGVASSILAGSHTFAEIDHEIISTAILCPSADSRRVVVSMCTKYWLTT